MWTERDAGEWIVCGVPIGGMQCLLCAARKDEDGKQNLKLGRAQSFAREKPEAWTTIQPSRASHVIASNPPTRRAGIWRGRLEKREHWKLKNLMNAFEVS